MCQEAYVEVLMIRIRIGRFVLFHEFKHLFLFDGMKSDMNSCVHHRFGVLGVRA